MLSSMSRGYRAARGIGGVAALLAASACATAAGTVTAQRSASPACAAAQQQVHQHLPRLAELDTTARATALGQYWAVVDTMLVECGKDARAMSAQFGDDWRIQSYFVREELDRLKRMSPSAITAFLPSHRARVERLMAMYAAMFANPGRGW